MIKRLLLLVPLMLFVIIAFFLWKGLSCSPHVLPLAQQGKTVPIFSLPRLGEAGSVDSKLFRGHYHLLNVWASWCDVCVQEQGFLIHLAQTGVKIVGMNYKDDPATALSFLKTFGNPYIAVGQDQTGQVGIELGVYGAPETFLISPEGRLLERYAGEMTQVVWKTLFLPQMHER